VNVAPKTKTTPRQKIAYLVRLFSTTARGERVSAWHALERTMENAGVSWSDVGNWIEHGNGLAHEDGKYTEGEMREFAQASRAEGIEEGIKIGMVRAAQNNGHITLPKPPEMAEYCHERLNRLRNDWQRDFIADIYAITRRRANLSLPRLANLAKIYIEIGGRI
jgi:hypothetical protein